MRIRSAGTLLSISVAGMGTASAQQKGQYILGTNGLNAGIQPDPGYAYSNEGTVFFADRAKGPDGQAIPTVGSFDLNIDQNLNSRYRVAAIGPQATFIVPKWNFNLFFRYEPEFGASATIEGTTVTFGAAVSFPATK